MTSKQYYFSKILTLYINKSKSRRFYDHKNNPKMSTKALTPPENDLKKPDPQVDPSPQNPLIQQLIHKVQTILPHLVIPSWILSPAVCLYLLKIGSFDTRLNLFLVLVYQYFFFRKTKILREILAHAKPDEFFKNYKFIIEDSEPLKESGSLFCFHPHGYFATGLFLAIVLNNTIKESQVLGSRMAIVYPWGGLFMKFLGIEGANPANFEKLLKERKNISFVPGGFEESTLTRYGKNRVFLKDRKGFIKLGLKHGSTLYPVYTFGETNMMHSISNEKLGILLNKVKLPGTLPYSKSLVLPNSDEELVTVIGKRIDLPIIKEPTQEDIDKYHGIYVENLKRFFAKYKREKDGDLEIC